MAVEFDHRAPIKREAWDTHFADAKRFMEERAASSTKTLIEVASQHPLVDGKYPNDEFAKRLDLGYKLYHEAKKKGHEVEIFVPGSRHVYEGVADEISLSEAGVQFLREEGIPREAIHGEDLITRYKGKEGVYNSADECFVASSYFKDGDFGRFIVVESPGQLQRKALHYIWFGVNPMAYTAPTAEAFHNPIQEVFETIPHVRDVDPSAQGVFSSWRLGSRAQRDPGLAKS